MSAKLTRSLSSSSSLSGSVLSTKSPGKIGSNSATGNGGGAATRMERNTNFKVVIRVRPPLPRELSGEVEFKNIVHVDNEREQIITVSENLEAVLDDSGQLLANPGPFTTHSFVFDHVYDQKATQKEVYDTTARAVVDSALQGYNATIFAYGQTGTGKTFTMEGFNREGSVEARGIIPRAIEQIFGHIQRHASPRMRFLVRASYLQIYNEAISDLLKPERSNLVIREDKRRGVFVEDLSEWVVRSPAEIYGLMERGGAVRATGETKMNELSSRSHAVFIVIAEQSETVYVDEQGAELTPEEFQKFMHSRGVRREQEMSRLEDHVKQSFKIGKLNLVDLAGSERVRLSGAVGQRLEESIQINKSLLELGNVIHALADAKSRQHIPYRNSKLTRMLADSLGGNCRTTMMAMISPALEAMVETVSTLKFANRAKNIRNEAKVNEDLDQKSLLRKYERELKKLRAELEEKNKNVVDKRRLLELDEQRRRAEADKMAAIRALEVRSMEFMQEKEEKKRLEQRIAMLMSQMIRGEKKHGAPEGDETQDGSDQVELQEMMKEQQDKLRQEYEGKLADLERERETIEEEKAQVDRYKQLLLKQRDIMIALTQRLVERDEQIMALQDELDAYDRHQRELEEKLDEKTAMLIRFQRISMEVNATSPTKNEELSKALEAWSQFSENGRKGSIATELDSKYSQDDPSITSGKGLTASNDRVLELNAMVSSQRMQIAQLSDELNDLKADRIRPNDSVERIVNEEFAEGMRALDLNLNIEPRQKAALFEPISNSMGQILRRLKQRGAFDKDGGIAFDSDALQALKSENNSLLQRIRLLEASTAQPQGSEDSTIKARCDLLVKEREAVHTIMEQKIKVLVQGVSNALGAVLQTAPMGGGPAGAALAKDVAALQRLVNASIAALRNAASVSIPANNPGLSSTNSSSFSSSDSVGTGSTSQKLLNSISSISSKAMSSSGPVSEPSNSQRIALNRAPPPPPPALPPTQSYGTMSDSGRSSSGNGIGPSYGQIPPSGTQQSSSGKQPQFAQQSWRAPPLSGSNAPTVSYSLDDFYK